MAKSPDGAEEPWLDLRYVIDQLDFNQPIDPSQFTLPQSAMETVIDYDQGCLKWKKTDRKEFCNFPSR